MLKDLVKRIGHGVGLDVRRWDEGSTSEWRTIRGLETHHVNVVFDIGANKGQFGRSLWNSGYQGRIVSFEPLSGVHAYLSRLSGHYPGWEIAPRMAVGGEDATTKIHISGNSVSSSLREMLEFHREAAPESEYCGTEPVIVRRLDTVGPPYLRPDSVAFLKIDTQGFEGEVLRGGSMMLQRAVGVHIEASLVPLYHSGIGYGEVLELLQPAGFEIWNIEPGFTHPKTGRVLQVDITLYRRDCDRSRRTAQEPIHHCTTG